MKNNNKIFELNNKKVNIKYYNINPYDLNEISKHFKLNIKSNTTRPLNNNNKDNSPYDAYVDCYTNCYDISYRLKK
jgi:hypothetical protein